MIVSRNELASQITKACLGAGLHRGHAEDFGAAVARAASFGSRDAGVFATALEDYSSGEPKTPCVLIEGPLLMDARAIDPAQAIRPEAFDHPRLMELLMEAADDVSVDTLKPVEVDSVDWNRLRRFAKRLLVKADGATRLADAGAGLNDND